MTRVLLLISVLCMAGVRPAAAVTSGPARIEAVFVHADTVAPRRPWLSPKEARELRRLERADRNLAKYARRHDGRLPRLHETAAPLDIISFGAAILGLGAYVLAVAGVPFIVYVVLAAFPAALVCGIIARRRIKYGASGRRGLALAGSIIGAIFTVAIVVGGIAAFIFAISG